MKELVVNLACLAFGMIFGAPVAYLLGFPVTASALVISAFILGSTCVIVAKREGWHQ